MREIQFRGLRTLNGEWVYGNLLIKQADSPVPETSEPYKCYYIVPIDGLDYYEHEIDPDTIGQYTGLNDIEGNEIYEGDIIRHSISTQQAGVYPIGWDEDTLSWATGWREPISEFGDIGDFSARARIIGNIHDNPELLER